ncbi:MAG: peptidase S24, partial [Flavobacteriaceae bacterium]|nr:peptidase S24 [Flavobacteriaceae bacterium]
CFIDGDFTVKRIIKKGADLYLKAENKNYKPIKIDEENELQIWGIVTYVIKSL